MSATLELQRVFFCFFFCFFCPPYCLLHRLLVLSSTWESNQALMERNMNKQRCKCCGFRKGDVWTLKSLLGSWGRRGLKKSSLSGVVHVSLHSWPEHWYWTASMESNKASVVLAKPTSALPSGAAAEMRSGQQNNRGDDFVHFKALLFRLRVRGTWAMLGFDGDRVGHMKETPASLAGSRLIPCSAPSR